MEPARAPAEDRGTIPMASGAPRDSARARSAAGRRAAGARGPVVALALIGCAALVVLRARERGSAREAPPAARVERGAAVSFESARGSGRVPVEPLDDARSPLSVRGTLTDAGGAPLPAEQAIVALEDAHGTLVVGRARADGSFAFGGLAPGAWRARCPGPDVRGEPVAFEIASAAEPAEVDLVVERGRWVAAAVLAAPGEPLAMRLIATGACPPLPEVEVVDSSGLFGAVAPGEGGAPTERRHSGTDARVLVPSGRGVEVVARLAGRVLARAPVRVADERVELTVSAADVLDGYGTVAFTVVDGSGALPDGLAARGGPRDPICPIDVQPDGTALWRCPPGDFALLVQAPGRATFGVRGSLPFGGRLELGRIVLAPALAATGEVVDRAGRPCSVPLRLESLDGDTWSEVVLERPLQSSAGGRVVLESLAAGRYRLTALVGGSVPTEIELGGAAPDGFRVLAGPP